MQHLNARHRYQQLLFGGFLAIGIALATLPSGAFAQASPEAIRNYNQGFEAYNHGNIQEALKKFTKAVQIDPNYTDAYYNMGSLYYQNKQYNEAAGMFQKVVNLNPVDSQAKFNLALCYEKLNRTEEAINQLSQIPANDPKAAQARTKMDELKATLKTQTAAASKPATTKPTSPSKPLVPATTGSKLASQTFSKGFDGPTGIAIGPGGFMYVANYSKNIIYRVGAGGEKTVFAQGDALKGPIGLTYNPKTNELYVANYLLNSISRINDKGQATTLVGGLNKPYNLYLDTINNVLYVSEQDPANQISRITLP